MDRPLQKALFLDRDGILIEDTGYVSSAEGIQLLPATLDLCRAAHAKGYIIVVVTNQSGVARGYFTEEAVSAIHAVIAQRLSVLGIDIAAFYSCPHHPKGCVPVYAVSCDCRKPRPGLIDRAVSDFGIDVSLSLMVGDKKSDRIEVPGLRSVIVKSRYLAAGEWDVETVREIEALL